MLRFTFRSVTFPLRLATRTGRRLGIVRLLAFVAGVGTGLLVAREPGQDLRERLRRRWEDRQVPATELELVRRVHEELAQSPRTWHLPQPEVDVVSGRLVLSGAVPHATGREEIERVAAAVPGVGELESHLAVEGPD